MEDLERVLESVEGQERKKTKKSLIRRFIIVEGLYQYHGDICKLDRIVELAKKFKYRIMLEDSLGFGVLGATGKGTPEHFNVPMSDIDCYCINADTALATTGGFCIGSHTVVDHQRLSGAGYCFSAASPPFCSAAGVQNITMIADKGSELSADLRSKAKYFRGIVRAIDGVTVQGDDVSPVVHFRLVRSLVRAQPISTRSSQWLQYDMSM